MRFRDAVELIGKLPVEQSVLLLGAPGSAKSSCTRAVGEACGSDAVVEVRDLCSHLPEDLLGLPYREDGVTRYAPPGWLARLAQSGVQGVLVLDDLSAASPSVQTAAFKLVLERRAGDITLAPGVRVMGTANRREDRSGATALPAALRNRCVILELVPDIEEWAAWALSNGVHELVPAFLRFRPALLSVPAKEADQRGAFASPRSWAALGRSITAVGETPHLFELAAGHVGEGPATEFVSFCRLHKELPDPRALLADPMKALPDPPSARDPSRLIALGCAVSGFAAKSRDRDAPLRLLRALGHVSREAREYAAVGVSTYGALGGDLRRLVEVAQANRKDQLVGPLLRHLGAAVA